jgi:hypothetical protein
LYGDDYEWYDDSIYCSYGEYIEDLQSDIGELEALIEEFKNKKKENIEKVFSVMAGIVPNDIELIRNNYRTNGTARETAIVSLIEWDNEWYSWIMWCMETARIRHEETSYDLDRMSNYVSKENYEEFRKEYNKNEKHFLDSFDALY